MLEASVGVSGAELEVERARVEADRVVASNSYSEEMVKKQMRELSPRRRGGVAAKMSIRQLRLRGDSAVMERLDTGLSNHSFFITQADMPRNERISIMGTFGSDPDVMITFGEEPHIWSFSGMMRNEEGRGAWHQEFSEFYDTHLRASIMVRNRQILVFRLGNIEMEGYLMSYRSSQDSNYDDAGVQFSINMYVRSYRFTEGSVRGVVEPGISIHETDGFDDFSTTISTA